MDALIREYQDTANLLKILSHPVRLCIIKGLMEKECCNVSYMQRCLGLPQSSISTHLQKLRAAGIVHCERKGLEVTYRLANDKVKNIINILFYFNSLSAFDGGLRRD